MRDLISAITTFVVVVGYTLGPLFGIYQAIVDSSVFHGFMSLFIPFYGMIYWMVA